MKTEIESRLKILKEEYQKGQKQLVVLNKEATELENTMLRITGAIQVLEELLVDKDYDNSISSSDDSELTK